MGPPLGASVDRYRLWRSVNGGDRHLIATVAGDAALLRHADRNIRTGSTYRYFVAALNAEGRVAKSEVRKVSVGRPAEVLRFNCIVEIDEGIASVVCRWSDTTRASAVKYVLYRTVDGGARQAITAPARTGAGSSVIAT